MARPAASTSTEFEAALHDVALSLTKQVARDGEGAETLIEVHVDGRVRRCAGETDRQGHRQLPARQDRRARRRPQLGTRRDGDRQGHDDRRGRPVGGVIRLRRLKRCTRRRRCRPGSTARRVHARRHGAHRGVSLVGRARPRARCGVATSPTATYASTPTTRPDSRQSVTSVACGCRRRRGSVSAFM